MTEQEIRALFEKHKATLGERDVWHVQGQPVIKHSALERLAVAINIQWVKVEVIRNERDEAVVLVYGKRGDKEYVEFSFGEAVIGLNYRVSGKQAAYVWAMAEKRAKDRVIIKLADLHGAYSSEDTFELDEPAQIQKPSPVEIDNTSDRTLANALIATLDKAESQPDLARWFTDNRATIEGLPEALRDEVRSSYAGRLHTLKRAA